MQSIQISGNYAGGNIRCVAIEDDVVKLEQELRDTAGWWFYWSFCASASQDQAVVFEFVNGEVVGPWGPAVSKDGVAWDWLGTDHALSRQSFRYSFQQGEKVYFSFCIPYQLHHFERFYSRIASHPLVSRKVLTNSEQLRLVPLLTLGNAAAKQHIMLTCRHHACESPPSYLIEGLLEYYLEQAESPVLNQYMIHYIPFVDIDGVENGDQGKSRVPHDHNRDYRDEPIYRSTAAIIHYAKSLDLVAGIDFHSPYKWGEGNDFPFIVKKAPPIKEENERFGALLEKMTLLRSAPNPITYDPAYDIEMGEGWNQPHGTTCSAFFEKLSAKLAFTFEFPYFGVGNTVYTQHNCREFGADFAKALEAYLLNQEG